jgi:arginyl-tRNA synthetase
MAPTDPVQELRAAVTRVSGDGHGGRITLDRPRQAGHGDYATNAALVLAKGAGKPPRDVAEQLAVGLREALGTDLADVQVAGPGFLNLFLSDAWFAGAVEWILGEGDRFGSGMPAEQLRVLVEFVSANPTGPLTAASGRHAAYGDGLARLLTLAGHRVEREYYFNDAGTQIRKLGESIRARARGEELPEDGYQGDYVSQLAQEIEGAAERDPDDLAREGVELMFARIKKTLSAYGVQYDHFFNERSLHQGDPSPIEAALAKLEEKGLTYEKDGALWLRTTDFGEDQDRVLRRSSGETTYFAADVAYHTDKLERGYDQLINVLGADHHGYVARMKALMTVLCGDPDRLEIPLLQFVHLVESGERASMSKRRGDFVTLDDLIAEIGVDATRFFMLQRSHDSTIDLDLDLAKEESAENPVYYVQYAHARIASVLRKAGEERVKRALAGPWNVELHPSERALVAKLLTWPDEVAEAAERRAVHRIAVYALELAQAFTAFYRDCLVVGAEPEELESFRIALSVATQRTIAGSLAVLGVSAPLEM